jgi:hypothetical protein
MLWKGDKLKIQGNMSEAAHGAAWKAKLLLSFFMT